MKEKISADQVKLRLHFSVYSNISSYCLNLRFYSLKNEINLQVNGGNLLPTYFSTVYKSIIHPPARNRRYPFTETICRKVMQIIMEIHETFVKLFPLQLRFYAGNQDIVLICKRRIHTQDSRNYAQCQEGGCNFIAIINFSCHIRNIQKRM